MIDNEQKTIKISLGTFILGFLIISVTISAISIAIYVKSMKISKTVINLQNVNEEKTKNEI